MSLARTIAAWAKATATQKGPIELATQAEVDTGTDTERAVTGETMHGTQLPGALIDVQVFESSGTWTKPAGAGLVEVWCLGAGGGGAGAGVASGPEWRMPGSGGGGGCAYGLFLESQFSATETVTVGAAGAGGAAGNNNGTQGGHTYFSAAGTPWVVGYGGGAGSAAAANNVGLRGSGNSGQVVGEISGTELILRGGSAGECTNTPDTITGQDGGAGGSPWGGPVNPGVKLDAQYATLLGVAGPGHGVGGTGAVIDIASSSATRAGGAGAKGLCVVKTYG